MGSSADQPVVWCVLDSRLGHQNQVLGLADAIERRCPVKVHQVPISGLAKGIFSGLAARSTLPADAPDLIVGAGHKTHMPLLQLGRRFSAKTVVLMKPTFPIGLFDLCILPDVYKFNTTRKNILRTTGVLNRICPSDAHAPGKGIILVGGPCSHHDWSNEAVLRQLTGVLQQLPDCDWRIATSRRTPKSFIDICRNREFCSVFTPDEVFSDWLPQQLRECGIVWVTEDSVSMMYEAVTSGAACGMLELPRTRTNRAVLCVDLLVRSHDVTPWTEWKRTGRMHKPIRQLAEADRCADELLSRGLLRTAVGTHRET